MHLLSATTLATDPSSLLWYLDSAASLHCTFDILDIVDPVQLPEPLPIGSANGGIISATHSGRSHLSPLILVHYVPESKVKLISLGALTRQRFTYSIGQDRAMTVFDPSGKHLFTCALQPNNVWTCPPILMAPPPTRRLLVAPANPSFFTKEQVHRAVLCRQLHEFLGHPNDDALKTVLNQATFAQYSPLVSADVDLMQSFFESCVSCGVGKMHYQDLHSDSTSSPSAAIGDRVFFDPYPLPCTTHGGNTVGVNFVDDWSHFTTVLGAKFKSHKAILECVTQPISIYNARGHQIKFFCTDSEPICESLTTPLGLLHCSISHTTPDMHCHKVERVTQVIDNKAVAVLAGLPYRLSPTLILHLKAFIANQLNHTAQSTLHTAVTPYWSFYKAKPVLNKDPAKAFLPFGATVLIKLTDGQRTTLASKESLNTNNVAKSALAINLGTSIHHPGDNMSNTRHPSLVTSSKPLTTPSCDHPSTNSSLPTSHPSYLLLQLLVQRLLLTFRC
jgi:hypothetical protein